MKTLSGLLAGGLTLAGLALAPSLAEAAPAYTNSAVNLRAGPGVEYPLVFTLQAGTALETYGCLSDWSWCDVSVDGYRGWVYGGYLSYTYDNQRVVVLDYGPRIGLPVITFSFGDYWNHYYRNRPFYRDRTRYEHIGIQPFHPNRGNDHNDHNDRNDRNDRGNNNDHSNDHNNGHDNNNGRDNGRNDNNRDMKTNQPHVTPPAPAPTPHVQPQVQPQVQPKAPPKVQPKPPNNPPPAPNPGPAGNKGNDNKGGDNKGGDKGGHNDRRDENQQ